MIITEQEKATLLARLVEDYHIAYAWWQRTMWLSHQAIYKPPKPISDPRVRRVLAVGQEALKEMYAARKLLKEEDLEYYEENYPECERW